MRSLHSRALAVAMIATLAGADGAAAQSRSGKAARAAIANPVANEGKVDPRAIEALKAMSAYLGSAPTLAITSKGSLDVVTGDDQRIQLDGTTKYKIRRPGFVIDYDSDVKSRRFIYDGKTFTVYSPNLGFYSTVAAPPTNREALDTIYKKFGIALPLEDLFRWNEGATAARLQAFKSAYDVGPVTLDGVPTEHYAFREAETDWEVWIQQGAQPVPRKLVIVDRTDASRPTFIARLDWEMNPTFTDSDFTFVADADAKRIQMATFKGSDK